MHVGADCAGVLEAGGDLLLLPESMGVRLLLHGVVPRLREGWYNNWFESHIIGTLLKIDGCKDSLGYCKILIPCSGKWEVRLTNQKVRSPEILGMEEDLVV